MEDTQAFKRNRAEIPVVKGIIGIVVAIIVIVLVAIPVVNTAIEGSGITDTNTLTILRIIPLFFGIAAFVMVTYIM